jgi:hypothetical protein
MGTLAFGRSLTEPADWSQRHPMGSTAVCSQPICTPIARFEWKDHRPYSAAFSPDGARIAVGDDIATTWWFCRVQPTQLFVPTRPASDNRNIAVAWSQDGRFLYAGGNWSVNNVRVVRR